MADQQVLAMAQYGIGTLSVWIIYVIVREFINWRKQDDNLLVIQNNTKVMESLNQNLNSNFQVIRETQVEHTMMLKELVRKE
jgi:hypothetical protein